MAPGHESQEGGKFCLKWDGFHSNLTSVFETLRQGEELVDITLCCEGKKLKAHKMMLSAASPFFRDLLQENPCQHPVFFLRDTRCQDMAAIIEFVYRGSVNVSQAQLASFIQTAELLQIRGLSGDDDAKQRDSRPSSVDPAPAETPSYRSSHHPTPSSPVTPQRYRASGPGGGRPEPATPPSKRRRMSTTSPPPPPLPLPPPGVLTAQSEAIGAPPAPPPPPESRLSERLPERLPETMEHSVKQEKVEVEVDEVQVYEPGVPSSFEQMIFMPQQYQRGINSGTGTVPSTPPAGANSSDDQSQASFACPVCGSAYKSSYSLQQHMRVHEGRTLCPVCGVTQSRVTNLRRHLMIRHNMSKEQACGMVPMSGGGAHWERADTLRAETLRETMEGDMTLRETTMREAMAGAGVDGDHQS